MGLDTVELVMTVEEQFDIEITNDEAERINTVRQMIDLVFSKVEHREIPVCRTQQTFYRLRRGIRDTLGIERSRIKPDTAWSAIIPQSGRKDIWQKLRATAGNPPRWPQLRRAPSVVYALAALTLATTIAAYMATGQSGTGAIVAAAVSVLVLRQSTEHLRTHFSPESATIGQVVKALVPLPQVEQIAVGNRWTREQVRVAVRKIVIDHLNVDPNFSDDASFVDDLGAD